MLLEIEDLHLGIAGTPILNGVHLAMDNGEIYGFLGPNGAGKSTTIAAAVGLLAPKQGTIRMMGHPVRANDGALRRRLGVLPEQTGFYDWMTPEAYLSFFARLYGLTLSRTQISGRLVQVGLSHRPAQLIGTFSRGMRQRLGLARALIGDPQLLILDEPTNGLDPRGRREIHDILLELAANGTGILMCTHLLDDVERLCKRIGVIVDGKTVIEGAINELVQTSGQRARFGLHLSEPLPKQVGLSKSVSMVAHEGEWLIVDLDANDPPEQVWRELLFNAWPIVEIRREGGGLEALYLTLSAQSTAQ